MHLRMPGWPKTLCNRDTWSQRMETTERPDAMTCQVCASRWKALQRVEIYAGEEIPVVQIEYWARLPTPARFRFCRRFTETQGMHRLRWYQYSKRQRDLLLSMIRMDGAAAWALGIPGTEPEPMGPDSMKPVWRAQRRIIRQVMMGKQDPADLRRVLELQDQLARGVFDG